MTEYRSKEVQREDLLLDLAAYQRHVDDSLLREDYESADYWRQWVNDVTMKLEAL